MYRLGQCTLVYVRQAHDENYNPITETASKVVKCKIMDAFSVNYYQNQTRDMRKSKNIIVAKPYTNNLVQNNESYQLERVEIGSVVYTITNILKDRNSDLNAILDCQEVINE